MRLQVTDNDGASDVTAKTINVVNRAPTASIDLLLASPASLEPVTFSAVATDVDGTIATMLWDTDNDGSFDDGIGPAAIRSFPSKGTYTVKVRVADDQGLTAIGTRVVTIANRLPVATFSHNPGSPNSGEPVMMTSTSTDLDGTIATVEWDTDNDGAFDDATGTSTARTFTISGNKTVKLRVTDNDGGQTIGSQVIVVANGPPDTSITSGGPGATNDSTPQFTFEADEAGAASCAVLR